MTSPLPSQSVSSPSLLVISCASPGVQLGATAVSSVMSFRNHPRVIVANQLFSSVILSRVVLNVAQLEAPDASADYTRFFFRFGVVPRGISAVDPATRASVVAYMPHMHNFATNHSPVDASVTFGDGGLPFPPGIQLDLRAAEVVNNYAEAFIGFSSVTVATGSPALVVMSVEFDISCSSQGFGSVY